LRAGEPVKHGLQVVLRKNRSIRFGGQANILSNSGGNQLLKGTKMSYGGSAAFNASVGEKARSDARIILEGIKNSTPQSRTQEVNYVVWQKMVNQGSTAETLGTAQLYRTQ
jgi:hypothetical protein